MFPQSSSILSSTDGGSSEKLTCKTTKHSALLISGVPQVVCRSALLGGFSAAPQGFGAGVTGTSNSSSQHFGGLRGILHLSSTQSWAEQFGFDAVPAIFWKWVTGTWRIGTVCSTTGILCWTTVRFMRSSPEPLEWEHWLQDPRLPEN